MLVQTLLFSATMPSALHEFAKAGLKDPEMVRLDTDTKISSELSTAFFTVRYRLHVAEAIPLHLIQPCALVVSFRVFDAPYSSISVSSCSHVGTASMGLLKLAQ